MMAALSPSSSLPPASHQPLRSSSSADAAADVLAACGRALAVMATKVERGKPGSGRLLVVRRLLCLQQGWLPGCPQAWLGRAGHTVRDGRVPGGAG